jgi:hypothetical protein
MRVNLFYTEERRKGRKRRIWESACGLLQKGQGVDVFRFAYEGKINVCVSVWCVCGVERRQGREGRKDVRERDVNCSDDFHISNCQALQHTPPSHYIYDSDTKTHTKPQNHSTAHFISSSPHPILLS